MKKTLLLFAGILFTMSMNAQTEPVITMTAEVDGNSRAFSIGSVAAGATVTVDWGDGNIVAGTTTTAAYDPIYGEGVFGIQGTPVGEGKIKIYSIGDLALFDCTSRIDGPG